MSNVSAKILGVPSHGKSITIAVTVDGKENMAWVEKGGKIFPPRLDKYRKEITQSLNEDPRFKKVRLQLLLESFHHEDAMLKL